MGLGILDPLDIARSTAGGGKILVILGIRGWACTTAKNGLVSLRIADPLDIAGGTTGGGEILVILGVGRRARHSTIV